MKKLRVIMIDINDIIRAGKSFCETHGQEWKESREIPFNVMLSALFNTTGLGDEFAERCFNEIKQRAKNLREIPMYLESLSDIELEELAKDIKFNRRRFLNGVRGIKNLNKKYDLQRDSLSHISRITTPEEFYNSLKSVSGFGGKEIGPWVECEFVRLWSLQAPANLELPSSTQKCLEILKINLNDVRMKAGVQDYSYIDAFFEKKTTYKGREMKLRILARHNPKKFKEEVVRALNDL